MSSGPRERKIAPWPAFAGPDEAAIIAGTKKYLAAQSYSADMDGATVFLTGPGRSGQASYPEIALVLTGDCSESIREEPDASRAGDEQLPIRAIRVIRGYCVS